MDAATPSEARPEPSYLDPLTAAQRRAVEHGIEQGRATIAPPLLIIAGAGSGKTNTLAHRVAHLLACGADPQRLLLLTFSRRAAAELERRAGRLLAAARAQQRALAATSLPWAGTFHSVAARLLREYAPRIGLDPQFTIQDRTDSEDLLGLVRHEGGFAATTDRFPGKGTCLAIYSRAVNAEESLADVLARDFPWCAGWQRVLTALFDAYVQAKQAQNVLDFDDLLLYWAHMARDSRLGRELGARFDHVLVDEYQDTNRLQAAVLLGMKPDGGGLSVVGDDAQAIYSFRAATVRNILDFPASFSPPARVITLEHNYRSSQPILDAANAVIALARERFTKDLRSTRQGGVKPELMAVRDEADQARCVAEHVLAECEKGTALKSQAVLFRSSAHSAQLELELARRGIPYVKYGGLRFLEAAHVKDVLSVLRFAENPRGRMAGFRALQLLPGIGPATAAKALDAVASAADPGAALASFAPPSAAAEAWPSLTELYRDLRRADAKWPAPLDRAVAWYAPHLERIYEDPAARRADLAQLRAIAGTYASQERFLTELTLDPPAASSAEAAAGSKDDDYLVLSTIHSAKGQEWKTVHVLNAVDGCMPSDLATGTAEEIEEERRLLYVAMTRARDHLVVMVPQRFFVHQQNALGDRHVYAARTRFIPDAILDQFQQGVWPLADVSAREGARAESGAATLDIAARMRAAWR